LNIQKKEKHVKKREKEAGKKRKMKDDSATEWRFCQTMRSENSLPSLDLGQGSLPDLFA